MSSNYLEELAREYYEYKRYFVRSNIRFGKRGHGGYDGEIDLLAYDPEEEELLHIECSMDAKSKKEELEMAEKKFPNDIDYGKIIPFKFKVLRKIFIMGVTREQNEIEMPEGVEHISLGPFIKKVYEDLPADIINEIVTEARPLLRTIQLSKWAITKK